MQWSKPSPPNATRQFIAHYWTTFDEVIYGSDQLLGHKRYLWIFRTAFSAINAERSEAADYSPSSSDCEHRQHIYETDVIELGPIRFWIFRIWWKFRGRRSAWMVVSIRDLVVTSVILEYDANESSTSEPWKGRRIRGLLAVREGLLIYIICSWMMIYNHSWRLIAVWMKTVFVIFELEWFRFVKKTVI